MSHYIIEHGVEITTRVFIGNIPYNTNETELKDFFSQYGTIKDCNIVTDRKGISKGYGFVTFKDEVIAKKVLQMAKVEFNHKTLNICRAIRKKNTGQYKYNGSNAEYIQAESNPVSIINYQGRNFYYNNGILEPLNNELHQTGIMLYSAVVLPHPPQFSPSVPQYLPSPPQIPPALPVPQYSSPCFFQ
ncbi:PREDICTED: protein boule-like [Amphimedon queenslandica]|uniref:RRM domain-containing protein n=1 Tax=Amphimedon queenslandica TaxID=400682 RepID=A0A1X7VQF2_AMPQE|nr:PREDICTED: protein boule-like [Amphimedon queenslandica]XP_019857123.1 PREDICTED: protein boule-like [Amphimedon queenslandica]|eukprot:XP_011407536.1 PREDICTED: protein boule-like [Amphimedon queenslandica]